MLPFLPDYTVLPSRGAKTGDMDNELSPPLLRN